MPCSPITDKYHIIIRICRRQMLQKDIHTDRIAVWEDKEVSVTSHRIYCSIGVSVLPNMVAWYPRTHSFAAPAVLRLIDPPKTCFVLKHKPNPLGVVENFGQFMDSGVNFFEASIASGVALFGCLLRGSFFVQPCRCSTKYICP